MGNKDICKDNTRVRKLKTGIKILRRMIKNGKEDTAKRQKTPREIARKGIEEEEI